MRLSTTRMFPLLLMLALAGLTFWLERTVREEEGVHPSQRRHDPDYVVDNLTHTRFDVQGRVESTLVAMAFSELRILDDNTLDNICRIFTLIRCGFKAHQQFLRLNQKNRVFAIVKQVCDCPLK